MKYILDDLVLNESHATLEVLQPRLFRAEKVYRIDITATLTNVYEVTYGKHYATYGEEAHRVVSSPEIWNAIRMARAAFARAELTPEKNSVVAYVTENATDEFFDEKPLAERMLEPHKSAAQAEPSVVIPNTAYYNELIERRALALLKEKEDDLRLEKQNNKQRAGRRTSRKPTKRTANKKRAVARKPRKSGGR